VIEKRLFVDLFIGRDGAPEFALAEVPVLEQGRVDGRFSMGH
jgi:hypothetical protein